MMIGDEGLRILLRPINEFISDPSTTDAVVNRPQEIGVERGGKWQWHSVPELTFERLDAIGMRAGFRISQDLSPSRPMIVSSLPDGQRILVCRPPATSPNIIGMAIRKPAATARRVDDEDFPGLFTDTNLPQGKKHMADAELLRLYANRDWPNFIRLARASRKTMGACGQMTSGKTDILKRLLQETPPETRIVTLEDQPEFGELGPHNRLNLFYDSSNKERTAEKVLEFILRTRADEIWMQEIKGAEGWAFLRALAAGHKGGCTTWHAEPGREIDALRLMVQQHTATTAMTAEAIKEHLESYLDIILSCSKHDGVFKITNVWFKAWEEAKALVGEAKLAQSQAA